MDVNEIIAERKRIGVMLRKVTMYFEHGNHVIKKDGNKVGKKKYDLLLSLYFRRLQLKVDVNSLYGAFSDNSKISGQQNNHGCSEQLYLRDAYWIKSRITKPYKKIIREK